MSYLPTGCGLHDMIVAELFEKRSLGALIFLIDCGRELELVAYGKQYHISRHGAKKHASIWRDGVEQSFDSVYKLIENAVIEDKPFLSVWKDAELSYLY